MYATLNKVAKKDSVKYSKLILHSTRTSKPYDIMSPRLISWFIHFVVGKIFGLKLFNDCLVDDPRLILGIDNNPKITIVAKLCDLARGIITESHCGILLLT